MLRKRLHAYTRNELQEILEECDFSLDDDADFSSDDDKNDPTFSLMVNESNNYRTKSLSSKDQVGSCTSAAGAGLDSNPLMSSAVLGNLEPHSENDHEVHQQIQSLPTRWKKRTPLNGK